MGMQYSETATAQLEGDGEEQAAEPSQEERIARSVAATLLPHFEDRLAEIRDEVSRSHGTVQQSMNAALSQLRSELREEYGTGTRANALLEAIAIETYGEEKYSAWKAGANRDEENARLKRDAKEARDALADRQRSQPDRQRMVANEYATVHEPELLEYAREQGVDFAKAHGNFPAQLNPTRSDPSGWVGYKREARRAIDAMADEAKATSRPVVRADTTRGRGNGGTTMTWEQAQKTNRMLTPDEVFALTGD